MAKVETLFPRFTVARNQRSPAERERFLIQRAPRKKKRKKLEPENLLQMLSILMGHPLMIKLIAERMGKASTL